MVQNFGYHRRADGSCEVYHHGEYFRGFFPMRFFFYFHAWYVAWATEKHVNSELFGSESEEAQEEEEEQRRIIPLFVFKEFLKDMERDVSQAMNHLQGNVEEVTKHEDLIKKLQELIEQDDHDTAVKMSGQGKGQKLQLVIEDKATAAAVKEALSKTNISQGNLKTKEALNTLLTHPEVHA